MKRVLNVTCIMCIVMSLTAQKRKNNDGPISPYGIVQKADLDLRDCDFDKNAEALVLIDEGELTSLTGLEMRRRIRIKILNNKGLEWANVNLSYRAERAYQDIKNLEAQTYNLDESGNVVITKIDKKLIYEKKVNKKYNEKVFTFPAVKIGSIIEYKYTHTGIGLVDWYFQRSIPVKYSKFIIDLPSEFEISVLPYSSKNYVTTENSKGTRTIKTFMMQDEPGFHDEPFIINEDYYRDRLETKLKAFNFNGRYENRMINWPKVIKYLMEDEDFGVQLKREIPHTAELDNKLAQLKFPYEKMKAIYKYVQDNMQWNEYAGIWALDGVRAAWKDKKGTVGEINLILVNLLKDARLAAHPVLVSTHDNGVVNSADAGTYESPGFLQFNKVMAYVEIGDKKYVLDASQKETPVHLIPAEIVMSEGLVIEKMETSEWGWHTLWNKDLLLRNVVSVRGEISADGKMEGESIISSFDYARLARQTTAKKGKDKFIEKYITPTSPASTAADVSFENLDSDSLPFIQHIKFSQSLNASGDYLYFSGNMLSGLEKNPFVADNRTSDIFFGVKQSYTILGSFSIPEGYEFEELPKNMKMIMPDTSITITRIAQVDANVLMTKVQLDFKQPIYTASQYGELQEFYKRLYDLLNEQYVIHKKN